MHNIHPDWSIATLCRILNVPRSSFYHESERKTETQLREIISKIAGEWPRYGCSRQIAAIFDERVTAQMRREGIMFEGKPVGERRVRRLMHSMGLGAKPHQRKIRTTDSTHSLPRYRNLVKDLAAITHPDHVWVSDITYIALGSGSVYLAVLMDVYTRQMLRIFDTQSIRGWHLSGQIDGDLTRIALEKALSQGKTPEIHHSDQGGQYAAIDYVALLKKRLVRISMAACSRMRERVGCPEENGYAERLMRTIKEEHVSLTEYQSFTDALSQIGLFIEEVYQRKRIHSCLGYLTPVEFEAAYHPEARAGDNPQK